MFNTERFLTNFAKSLKKMLTFEEILTFKD